MDTSTSALTPRTEDDIFLTSPTTSLLSTPRSNSAQLARVPHPFPYQGSKRSIAPQILKYFPDSFNCLIEPFCGSAAVSLATSSRGLTKRFLLNDINCPLMALWDAILHHPTELLKKYERLWNDQQTNKKEFFFEIRKEFNSTKQPHHLLYLLARIVKGSVRYSSSGLFNQSADNRRLGMRPKTMRKHILSVSMLLRGRTQLSATDFRNVVATAKSNDLVYMDPPYQGTSRKKDHRYYNGLSFIEFTASLSDMNRNKISYIISYDGWTGGKKHGELLPKHLHLRHIRLPAGRSTQATFLGKSLQTVESLYLSPALVERLRFPLEQI